jgi:hypothetical protein
VAGQGLAMFKSRLVAPLITGLSWSEILVCILGEFDFGVEKSAPEFDYKKFLNKQIFWGFCRRMGSSLFKIEFVS